ncbi:sesquipedalian [Anaeramoeba flamelloides]|uniref:Sesquipedalian n=1 Tax=Anaeramoeba flamelloides TaxID=1746091 RepID=A0AAV7YK49_9EUKA|nr:sesquipedalian [Anaeramoeba flamelloides]KAJ6234842.1 sesquipedalian [Anaeramoeba flamelloides]
MSTQYYCVKFDYNATQNDELSLKVGDVIKLIRIIEEGWFLGENVKSQQKGAFPSNYVESCQAPQELVQKTQTNNRQNLCSKEGWLVKKGNKFKTWKKRYFKLFPRTMIYYKTQDGFEPLGNIVLRGSTIEKSTNSSKKGLFFISTKNRKWELRATDEVHRQNWFIAISEQIERVNNNNEEEVKKDVPKVKPKHKKQLPQIPNKPIKKTIQQKPKILNNTNTSNTTTTNNNNVSSKNLVRPNKPLPTMPKKN